MEVFQHLQELRGEHGRLQRKLEGLLSNDSLVYIKQADTSHEPFLVEISGDWIHVHAHGIAPGMPVFEFNQPNARARCDAAARLIKQLASGRRYPLLLVQPSGGQTKAATASLSPATYLRISLKRAGVNQGFEVLGEGQTSLPSRMQPETGP